MIALKTVHKFGGTSVGDATCFARVADIIAARANGAAQPGLVVVVSAMSGVTNQLIAGARAAAEGRDSDYREVKADLLRRHLAVVEELLSQGFERLEVGGLVEDRLHEVERLYRSIAVLGEVTPRGIDAVTSFGEQLSARILAAALSQRGLRAQAVLATELIVTDGNFGSAHPMLEKTYQRLRQRLAPLIEQGVIPVVTGYIAATETGIPTTLGRGGSDYSAAMIAAGLGAEEVCIWSDVNGILTADPNILPQARTLAELSYTEAAELAYFGAEVLHPKTIGPVVASGIPLRMLNSFDPGHAGTLIVNEPSAQRERLPAIISATGLSLIAIGSRDDSWNPQMAARALHRLGEAGLEVPMFSQSFSEHTLNLVVRQPDQDHCLAVLSREFGGATAAGQQLESDPDGQAIYQTSPGYTLGTRARAATVSVVGVPGWNESGAVSHAFAALGKQKTRIIAVAQSASENSVSICLPEEQLAGAVRLLHRELGLDVDPL